MCAEKRIVISEESERAKKRRPMVQLRFEVKEKKRGPPHWEEVWDKIEEMRKERDAPVDRKGADRLAEETSPEVKSYQTLIGLLLSAQTKDELTDLAMTNLKKHGLTVESTARRSICTNIHLLDMLNTSEEEIARLIRCVTFHERKATYIKKTSEVLKRNYHGVPPKTLEETLRLPGIGPKMAHLYLQHAHGITKGIGVDTHVHRISNRLHWVQTDNPEQTRKALEEWLPYDKWKPINKLMVGFGQQICRAIGPQCDKCLLSNGLCPSAAEFLPRAQIRTQKAEHASTTPAAASESAHATATEEKERDKA